MASKKILLLLGNDRHAYPLIGYLGGEAKKFGWKLRIGCLSDESMAKRIAAEKFASDPDIFNMEEIDECEQALKRSDVIIALLNDALVVRVADRCIAHRKTLISPSRLTRQMAMKRATAKEANTLLLMDCGFAPGLDHITAKKAIDNIHSRGGKITSFRTRSGSFIPDETSDNPFGFKLSESAAELLNSGRHINRYIIDGHVQHIPSYRLFEKSEAIEVPGVPPTRVIPEGDSLYLRKVYNLVHAHTMVKGKILPEGFDRFWHLLIRLGLTDTATRIDLCGKNSYSHLLSSLLPYSPGASLEERLEQDCGADYQDIRKLKWLGLFGDESLPSRCGLTPARVLEHLLESKLSGDEASRDCMVMHHEAEYEFRGEHYQFSAIYSARGDNAQNSALARATGYTCGVAAKCVLLGNITVKGIHIPVIPEIYDPLLNELEDLGIAFRIEDHKRHPEPVSSAA